VGIGELSPSKFKYETQWIRKDFINSSECQVHLRKFKSPIQDLLATVLVSQHHYFSRGSLVAFDSYQSEKVRNTPNVNLTVTTIWVRFTWRVLLVRVRTGSGLSLFKCFWPILGLHISPVTLLDFTHKKSPNPLNWNMKVY